MRLFIINILILFFTHTYSQTHTISGYITDISNGESIFGANIVIDSLSLGTTSNNFGFSPAKFASPSLRLPLFFAKELRVRVKTVFKPSI